MQHRGESYHAQYRTRNMAWFVHSQRCSLSVVIAQMGEAVTEVGAISAAAAFFRQELDACAWAERADGNDNANDDGEDDDPHSGDRCPFNGQESGFTRMTMRQQHQRTRSMESGAVTRLRLDIPANDIITAPSGARTSVAAADGGNNDNMDAPVGLPPSTNIPYRQHGQSTLELVVSRAAGPPFSPLESALAAQAAVLLGQSIDRIRAMTKLTATELALKGALRGMEEASAAVSALVGEREERGRIEMEKEAAEMALATAREETRRAEAVVLEKELSQREARSQMEKQNEELEEALSAAEQALQRAEDGEREQARLRAESEALKRRLAEVLQSVGTSTGVAVEIFKTAARSRRESSVAEAGEHVDDAHGEQNATERELIDMVEGYARTALRCCSAVVEVVASFPPTEPAVESKVGNAVGKSTSKGAVDEARHPPVGRDLNTGQCEHTPGHGHREPELRIPIPDYCHESGVEQATLSLRSGRAGGFTLEEKDVATMLATYLGLALFVVRQVPPTKRTASSPSFKKREEGTDGPAPAAAALGAERQTKALMHLLSGLHAAVSAPAAADTVGEQGEGVKGCAVVAKVVADRAGAAVSGCVDAALLVVDPQREEQVNLCGIEHENVSCRNCKPGGKNAGPGVPPKERTKCSTPSVWAEASGWGAMATGSRSRHGGSTAGVEETGKKEHGMYRRAKRHWLATIERAASQAAATGKSVCISNVGGAGPGRASTADEIICFSPVSLLSSARSDSSQRISAGDNETPAFWDKGDSDRLKQRSRGKPEQDTDFCTRCWGQGPEVPVLALTLRFGADSSCGDGGGGLRSKRPPGSAVRPGGAGTKLSRKLPTVSRAITAVTHAVSLAVNSLPAAAYRTPTSDMDDLSRHPSQHQRPSSPRPVRSSLAARNAPAEGGLKAVGRAADVLDDHDSVRCEESGGEHEEHTERQQQEQRSNEKSRTGPRRRRHTMSPPTRRALRASDSQHATQRPGRVDERGKRERKLQERQRLHPPHAAACQLVPEQLAERVRSLERKACGLLRTSEARASTALAKARADAMAVRGELQLAALERERLLQRLTEEGRSTEDRGTLDVLVGLSGEQGNVIRERRGGVHWQGRSDGDQVLGERAEGRSEATAGRLDGQSYLVGSKLKPPWRPGGDGGSGGGRSAGIWGGGGGISDVSSSWRREISRVENKENKGVGRESGDASGQLEQRRRVRTASSSTANSRIAVDIPAASSVLSRRGGSQFGADAPTVCGWERGRTADRTRPAAGTAAAAVAMMSSSAILDPRSMDPDPFSALLRDSGGGEGVTGAGEEDVAAASSSEALQLMTGVHARLSASLRKGLVAVAS